MTNTPSAAALQQAVAAVDSALKDQKLSASSATNLKRWLTEPFFAAYQPGILAAIQAGDFGRLDSVFWEVIPFGTGGRRGMMADYGSATINVRTIAESAQGLGVYLHKATGKTGGRAVIAHDTRNRSDEFARLTATTLAANGLHVFFFESKRSTPELSFAVRHLKCDVGVVVSASHNPPSDNGFKAYWSNGAQVLPPHDKGIIDCVYEARDIPTLDFDQAVADGKIEIIGEEVDQAYIDALLKLSLSKARGVSAVFTPLHGVGETNVYRLLREAGFDQVSVFEPQRAADGNFTNVPDQLPNPERTAVFKPVIEQAKKTGADLVLASDPDADRLGVCVRDKNGEYVHLTGNRVGALLTDYILRRRAAAKNLSDQHYVVETLVTTPLISAIAKSQNVRAIDDLLVGFKYIGQTMDREGPDKFVFGAEESLGYLAGEYARDKDAGIAARYVMELAAELKA
ncbi:MAG TPA: phospho-sugar mutase, partial [Planctomycetaceae bacterium]|nr:phospho-sugar mutase [Planctomycetaceae bacterium]